MPKPLDGTHGQGTAHHNNNRNAIRAKLKKMGHKASTVDAVITDAAVATPDSLRNAVCQLHGMTRNWYELQTT